MTNSRKSQSEKLATGGGRETTAVKPDNKLGPLLQQIKQKYTCAGKVSRFVVCRHHNPAAMGLSAYEEERRVRIAANKVHCTSTSPHAILAP